MKIIQLDRRSGKTTRALEWLAQERTRLLIVVSPDAANQAYARAKELGLSIEVGADGKILRPGIERRQIATAYDIMRGGGRGMGASALAVDNAEHVLYDILGAPVELLTLTETIEVDRGTVDLTKLSRAELDARLDESVAKTERATRELQQLRGEVEPISGIDETVEPLETTLEQI